MIPAEFRVFPKSKHSVFSVEPREGLISPHESVVLTVTANLDEVMRFKDYLTALITDGETVQTPLHAVGLGTAIDCEEDISVIDFGRAFS